LMHMSLRRSEMTSQFIPDLNLSWEEKLEILKDEIEALVPAGDTFVLIDDNQFGDKIVSGRLATPLLQRDGQSWGAPSDDASAIGELERLHQLGVNYIVITWPAFWWLDYYMALREYLSARSHCVLHNSRVIAFELAS
jgi:hypothetical protein